MSCCAGLLLTVWVDGRVHNATLFEQEPGVHYEGTKGKWDAPYLHCEKDCRLWYKPPHGNVLSAVLRYSPGACVPDTIHIKYAPRGYEGMNLQCSR